MVCRTKGDNAVVRLDRLAPEITLMYLPAIEPGEVNVLSEIAKGGSGIVYKGIWRGQLVAVKVRPPGRLVTGPHALPTETAGGVVAKSPRSLHQVQGVPAGSHRNEPSAGTCVTIFLFPYYFLES